MATGSLGTLFVELLLKDDQFRKDLGSTQTALKGTGGQLKAFGDSISGYVTKALAAASAALTGLMAASAAVGVEFERQITKVAVLTGNKAGGLGALSEAAREFGANTVFSASEAAQAMESLAQAGFSVEAVISGTDAALSLAAASGGKLADATAVVASTMSQFQMSTAEAGRIADVFTAALNTSQLNLDGLQVAMSYAGATGASLGRSIEEVTAAVAMFSNLGLDASKAGTAFRGAMSQLITVSVDGEAVLGELGLTTQAISPELYTFGEILKKIGASGMTATQAISVFGAETGGYMAALAQQAVSTETAFDKTYEDIVGTLQQSSGVAASTAADMLDNVSGKFEQAKGSFEELLLTVYDQYAGPLKDLLEEVGAVIDAVTANFRRNASSVGGYFTDTLGSLTSWLRENENYIAVQAVALAQQLTTIARVLASIVPYLDKIAVLMAAVFVVTQVTKFAAGLGTVYEAVLVVQAALVALGVEVSVMTAGVYAAVVAIGAIVAALGAYALSNREAEESANRLTQAQNWQRMVNDEAYRERSAQVASLLAQQKEAAAAELAANQGLSDARRKELREIIALDAATAALRVEAGELAIVNGKLQTAAQLVGTSGEAEAIKGIREEYAATAAEADRLGKAVEATRAHFSGDLASLAGDAQATSSYLDLMGQSASSLEDADAKLEALRARMDELTQAEQTFSNEMVLAKDAAVTAIEKQAKAEADAARGASEFSRATRSEETSTQKAIIAAREGAAQRTEQLYAEQLRALETVLAGEMDAIITKREQEIADARAAFAEEMALYEAGSAERVAIQARLDATLQAMRDTFAAEDKAAHDEALAEAQAALLESTKAAEAKAEEIRRAALPKEQQLALERNDLLAKMDADLQERLASIEGLGAEERAAMLAGFQRDSADERAAIEADYAKQIAAVHESGFGRATRAVREFTDKAKRAFDALKNTIGSITNAIGGMVEQITGFSFSIQDVITGVLDARSELEGAAEDAAADAVDAAQSVADAEAALAEAMRTRGVSAQEIRRLEEELDAARAAADAAQATQGSAEEAVAGFNPAAAAVAFVEELFNQAAEIAAVFIAAVPPALRALAAGIPGLIQTVVAGLPSIIGGVIDAVPLIFDAVMRSIPRIVTALIMGTVQIVRGVVLMLPDIITSLVLMIPRLIGALIRMLPQVITGLITLLPELIAALIRHAPEIAIGFVEALIFKLIPKLPMIALEFFKALVAGMGKAIKDIAEALWQAIKDFFNIFKKKDKGKDKDKGKSKGKGKGAFSGIDYIPATMRMTVHRGEAVIPADRNAEGVSGSQGPAAAGYAQNHPSFTGGAGSGGPIELAVLVDGAVVDGVLVTAMGKGRAPRLQRTIRRLSGVEAVVGFSRGRFNAWSV